MLRRHINFLGALMAGVTANAFAMLPLPALSALKSPFVGDRPRMSRRQKRGGPRHVTARNTSFRSLRRAVNTGGFDPSEPSIEEKMRHKWFRNRLAWAHLRVKLDQEMPGDRDLLKSVNITI